jgi:DNA-directed RNA polymerase subunit E'/Rpb7
MEQVAVFEEKVAMLPQDMNRAGEESIDDILLEHLKTNIEGKCSLHGYVVPGSLELLSRSAGSLENGRFTGNVIFYVQAQGKVYNPSNGIEVEGEVLKKNKMGLYIIYKDAIRILVPRDLHLGSEEFETIEVGEKIRVELRKSRFQVKDTSILSIAVLKGKVAKA